MKFIFIDGTGFGFKVPEIHEIISTDVEISDEIYDRFFELQSQGKHFKVKNINGITFDEIFEEYVPDPMPYVPSELDLLKQENEQLKLQMAQQNKDMTDFMDFYFSQLEGV